MDKLKPCPFCGKMPTIHKCLLKNDIYRYVIGCIEYECNVRVNTVSFNTEQEAIEAWNTRKGEDNG